MEIDKNPPLSKKSFLLRFFFIFLALNLGVQFTRIMLDSPGCGANKGYNAEAKQYVISINKAQQAYYTENPTFSNSFDNLGIGIKTKTRLFEYSIRVTKNAAFSYGIPRDDAYEKDYFGIFEWNKKIDWTRSYVGAVFIVPDGNTGERISQAIVCEANSPGRIQPPAPTIQNGEIVCGTGTKPLR